MKRIRLLLFGVLVFATLGVGYVTLNVQRSDEVVEVVLEEDRQEVGLVIDFGEQKIEESMALVEGEKAFSILQKVVDMKGLRMETKQYDFGIFVQSIDGYESGSEKAWIYFVNDESGNVSADQYELKNGDKVEWKYVEPNF